MTTIIESANAPTSEDRFHAICQKLRRDEPVSAAEARMFARWCERMVRANNRRQLERLVCFVIDVANNDVVDPNLAAADLLGTLDVDSI